MISVDSVLGKTNAKVLTTAIGKYREIMEIDSDVVFHQLSDLLMMAFTIGYRCNELTKSGGDPVVNVSSIDLKSQEEFTRLILHRHPDIASPNEVWQYVQEYADYGIDEIYKMMVLDKGSFNIDKYLEDFA